MGVSWGLAIVDVGLFLVAFARAESQLIVYRLLLTRSRILSGEEVYQFYQIGGVVLLEYGCLAALGVRNWRLETTAAF